MAGSASLRRWAGGLLAVAGVYVLAGLGWALLAGAALTFVTPAPAQLAAAGSASLRRLRAAVAKFGAWLAPDLRHRAGVTAMLVGLVLVPTGLWLQAGMPWAVMALGTMFTANALLLGWDPKP